MFFPLGVVTYALCVRFFLSGEPNHTKHWIGVGVWPWYRGVLQLEDVSQVEKKTVDENMYKGRREDLRKMMAEKRREVSEQPSCPRVTSATFNMLFVSFPHLK